MKPLRKIAFVANADKPGAIELARQLRDIVCDHLDECPLLESKDVPPEFLKGMDACCVIGGDGTILGVVPHAVRYGVPVIGVNHGKLGFLTTYTREEAKSCLVELVCGEYTLTHRLLLSCRTADGQEGLALNDVVIRAAAYTGLVDLEVRCDGKLMNNFSSDGLIFATPTGSTAYNLAANGPIVHPGARVIAVTPISPHTLSNRSVVLSSDVTLSVSFNGDEAIPVISVDGRSIFRGNDASCFPIEISASKYRFVLVHQVGYEHFAIVRSKLKW